MKFARHIDLGTLAGLILVAGAFGGGLWLEGIRLTDISQVTAALVVFAGTIAAVLISVPLPQTKVALKMLPGILRKPSTSSERVVETLISLAKVARARGVVALEQETERLTDPFLRKGMRLAVDSVGTEIIETVLDADMRGQKVQAEAAASVYETAAGYAPSLGMAGAAFGLIEVMKHLDHLEQVGAGVAAAFVATIYGVLLANLVLLPIATKIRARAEARVESCALMREGIVAISVGTNPSLIRLKLEALMQLEQPVTGRKRAHSLAA